jgi:hypothetical protein
MIEQMGERREKKQALQSQPVGAFGGISQVLNLF